MVKPEDEPAPDPRRGFGRFTGVATPRISSADFFGHSVSLDGDRMVVGAIYDRSCAKGVSVEEVPKEPDCGYSGAAHVFDLDPETGIWLPSAFIKPERDYPYNRYFGRDVSLSGDVFVVTGLYDDLCTRKGIEITDKNRPKCKAIYAVHVYERDREANTWARTQTLTDTNYKKIGYFGMNAMIHGEQLAVTTSNGHVLIYEKDPETKQWTRTEKIRARGVRANDAFGSSMAFDGERILVGAWEHSSCARGVAPKKPRPKGRCRGEGAAFLFERNPEDGSWRTPILIKREEEVSQTERLGVGGMFGISVALDGDQFAVGAKGESICDNYIGCDSAGGVHVYGRDAQTGAWSRTAHIMTSNPQSGEDFGEAIALREGRLFVSAPGYSSGREEGVVFAADEKRIHDEIAARTRQRDYYSSGVVFVFDQDPSTKQWHEGEFILKAPAARRSTDFGDFMIADGDRLAVVEDATFHGGGINFVYVFDAAPREGSQGEQTDDADEKAVE